MTTLKLCFFVYLVLQTAIAMASTDAADNMLRVYGPGGPHHVLEKCADRFQEKSGVRVSITKSLPHNLEQSLPLDGDIYYGGAEYMLEDFNRKNPGVLNMDTADKLHPRRIGIIVRKGNPLNIRGTGCLNRKEVDLLDVKLEQMRDFYNNPSDQLSNVKKMVYTGRQGLSAWTEEPHLDAWVTYKSWHALISDTADFIEIPGEEAIRYTPIALTQRTPHAENAIKFIEFLKSDEAKNIFYDHGWENSIID